MDRKPTYRMSRRRLGLGEGLATAAVILLALAAFMEYLAGEASPGPAVWALIALGAGLAAAAIILIIRTRRCPKCARYLGPDSIPRPIASRAGTFFCNHCGAQIEIR